MLRACLNVVRLVMQGKPQSLLHPVLTGISSCCTKVLVSGTSLGLVVASELVGSALSKRAASDWACTRIIDEFSLWSYEDARVLMHNCIVDPALVPQLMPPRDWFPGQLYQLLL